MPTVAVPAPVPAAVGTIDQRLNALATRMDDLQKTLDQATQQLGQVTNMVAMSAGAPSNKDVQDRLDKLEQEITTLHAMPAKTASHEKPMAPAALAAPSVKTTLKPVVKKVTHEVKPLVKPEAPVSWVLRAASPGQAWVATSAQAHDLKEVHVGDTLPGIGQVTAIQQEGDNWVVKGSKGMIQ